LRTLPGKGEEAMASSGDFVRAAFEGVGRGVAAVR
jgi:hypothetical protein